MSKRLLIGGLLAVGLMTVSVGTASAQFVTPFGAPAPFGGSFGAVYPTPSGGIVQKQAYSNPFTGDTFVNKTYSNPFTGVVANRQAFIPGGYPIFYGPAVPTYRNYGLGYPGYRYGYGGVVGGLAPVFPQRGFGINIGFFR